MLNYTSAPEIWREIKEFPDYQVSNLGRVKSLKYSAPHILSPSLSKSNGYYQVILRRDAQSTTMKIHWLVAEAFLGERKPEMTINHINGNKLDNRVENLEYLSMTDNMHHASEHGLLTIGSNHPQAKLSENDVIEIKRALQNYRRGMILDLARTYNVNKEAIRLIKIGRTWRHVSIPQIASATGVLVVDGGELQPKAKQLELF